MSKQRVLLLVGLIVLLNTRLALAQTGPPVVTPQQPPGSSLVGTEWSGTETLQGFAALTFQFKDQANVVMVDTQGSWPGTFVQEGSKVTLKFFNGEVWYDGTIVGKEMGGNAFNKKGAKWTWTTSYKSGGGGGGGTVVQPPATTGPVTPDALPAYLKSINFEPRVVTPSVGLPYCELSLKDNDGWTFLVEVHAQKTGGMWLAVGLQKVPPIEQVPALKLLRLLESNNAIAPCAFAYRAAENQICMRLEVIGNRPTEKSFRADLQLLTNNVRQTYPQWNTADWRSAPGPASD